LASRRDVNFGGSPYERMIDLRTKSGWHGDFVGRGGEEFLLEEKWTNRGIHARAGKRFVFRKRRATAG